MECTTLRGELMEVLYGEASPATARIVDAHCAACSACRDEFQALRRVRGDLAAWRLPEAGPRSTRRVGRWADSRVWTLASAAALLVALGGLAGFSAAEARFARAMDARDALVRKEIDAVRAEVRAIPPRDDQAVLAQVDDRIRQAEARQNVLLRAQLTDLTERTESQRRYDLARMSAGLSYLDGRTGQSMARATQLMGYVLQASEKR
jgi:hypothetical protein